ncbi:unnamed protein product, partial [Trichogramma brassicae]
HQKTIHEGCKDYICEKCEKKFRKKSDLFKHQRIIHEGRKDHACDNCEKKFGYKSDLLHHQKTVHEGRKDHACRNCERKFGSKSDLLKHQKIVHEGRKDYECDNCEKKFGYKSDLYKHQKTVHEGRKDYACDKCEKRFGFKSSLIRHRRAIHEWSKRSTSVRFGNVYNIWTEREKHSSLLLSYTHQSDENRPCVYHCAKGLHIRLSRRICRTRFILNCIDAKNFRLCVTSSAQSTHHSVAYSAIVALAAKHCLPVNARRGRASCYARLDDDLFARFIWHTVYVNLLLAPFTIAARECTRLDNESLSYGASRRRRSKTRRYIPTGASRIEWKTVRIIIESAATLAHIYVFIREKTKKGNDESREKLTAKVNLRRRVEADRAGSKCTDRFTRYIFASSSSTHIGNESVKIHLKYSEIWKTEKTPSGTSARSNVMKYACISFPGHAPELRILNGPEYEIYNKSHSLPSHYGTILQGNRVGLCIKTDRRDRLLWFLKEVNLAWVHHFWTWDIHQVSNFLKLHAEDFSKAAAAAAQHSAAEVELRKLARGAQGLLQQRRRPSIHVVYVYTCRASSDHDALDSK